MCLRFPYYHLCGLAVEDSEIILPNRTVPQDRINPNSIIVDLPTPPQLYRYVQFSSKLNFIHTYMCTYIAMCGWLQLD